MLRTFTLALLAIVMSVGLAQAKVHMQKPKLAPCEAERQVTATCLCGPGKAVCEKGMFCHPFMGFCRP